jgi:polar amino acid transport system substrate-binding protein
MAEATLVDGRGVGRWTSGRSPVKLGVVFQRPREATSRLRAHRPIAIAIAIGLLMSSSGCGDDSGSGASAVAGGVSLAGCARAKAASRAASLTGRTLQVAVSPLSPPYIFTGGSDHRIVGFDADFIGAWSRCLGVRYRWQVYQDFGAMVPAVQTGRADVVNSSVYVTPPRANQIDFVVFMKSVTGSAVRKGNPKAIRSLPDLCGRRDAQVVGAVEVPLIQQQIRRCKAQGKPSPQLTVYKDNNLAIRAILNGRADAFLADAPYVATIARRFPKQVETSFTLDNGLQIGIGVNKRQPRLRDAIRTAVRAIQANGTEARLLAKWKLSPTQAVRTRTVTR